MLMLKEEFQATRLVLETKIDLVKKETNVMKVELAELAVNVTEANMAIKLLRKDLDMEVNYNMHSNLLLHGFNCTNEIEKEITVYLKEKIGVKIHSEDISVMHKLPFGKPFPVIIIRFVTMKKRQEVFQAFQRYKRSQAAWSEKDPYITPHLSKRSRFIRAKFNDLKQEAFKEGKKFFYPGENLVFGSNWYKYKVKFFV
ncbi:hypothetical protein CHUAL_009883 [Chamberlinius hualienensis]